MAVVSWWWWDFQPNGQLFVAQHRFCVSRTAGANIVQPNRIMWMLTWVRRCPFLSLFICFISRKAQKSRPRRIPTVHAVCLSNASCFVFLTHQQKYISNVLQFMYSCAVWVFGSFNLRSKKTKLFKDFDIFPCVRLQTAVFLKSRCLCVCETRGPVFLRANVRYYS